MAFIQLFDPEALAQREALVATAVGKLAHLLKSKARRADGLREVAAAEGDEKAFQRAAQLDKQVLTIIEVVQEYRALVAQMQASNDSAWAMIELQDKRTAALKRKAMECQDEATRYHRLFDQLHETFTAYVAKQLAA
jgi:Mg2+ and Co2+ transporter CorA